MTVSRREHKGAAPATTLAGNITSGDTTITLTSGTNWPTGAVGNFYIVIDRGNASEEKVLCSARSTNSLTVTTRGVDDTSAAAHTAGVTVEHCLTAVELDQANQHQADTAVDDHTQYPNTTRHDVTARHTFGAALPTPAAPTTSAVGDSAATGAAAGPARADHTHGREAFTTTPSTQAIGDSASAGVATTVPRGDHKHAMPAFATNAVVLGTAAAAGAAATLIRSDATIAAFDATVPTTSAVADAAATGSAAFAARRDHVHGREAFASPVAVGSAIAAGSATTEAHSDHVHSAPQHTRVTGRTSSLVGGTPPAAGTGPWLEQFGTEVFSYTTGGNTISFPVAFPTGVVTILTSPGDSSGSLGQIQILHTATPVTVSAFKVALFTVTGAEVTNGTSVRVNWVAKGW